MTIRYLGVDVVMMPSVELSNEIFQNNIVDVSTRFIKKVNFHLIFLNAMYVVTANYFKKTKKTVIEFNK